MSSVTHTKPNPEYLCPKCGQIGIPSVYFDDCCTDCANERRFGTASYPPDGSATTSIRKKKSL